MNSVLAVDEWVQIQSEHRERASQWTEPRRLRKLRGEREPVLDFLFEYYPYSPTKLEQWFPGVGNKIEIDPDHFIDHKAWQKIGGAQSIDPNYIEQHRKRLEFALSIISGIDSRPATLNCFGLHEWAMVYRASESEIRHPDPLRLDPSDIEETVNNLGLRCTHIDAFRFFTAEAAPRNHNTFGLIPTRENQARLDQKGCLHANMDLYKYCMWFQPLVPGDLVLDCFELAIQTRELDMRASPYDLTEFGYLAIPIETAEGRAQYAMAQREIMDQAAPLRESLRQHLTHGRAVALQFQ